MNALDQIEEVVGEGEGAYSAGLTYKIQILKTDFKPGSGDYEDPPEDRNDQIGKFFKVIFTPPGESNSKSGGGYYPSIEEAKEQIAARFKGVIWKEGF